MAGWAIERSRKHRNESTVTGRRAMQRASFAAMLLRACLSCGFCVLLLGTTHAHAARAKPTYEVDVEAEPRSLRKLLEEHLDISASRNARTSAPSNSTFS